MAPVKSQSFSRHKGKEVSSDPPAVPDVGEEAEYFESEHSVGEEAHRNPDSECSSDRSVVRSPPSLPKGSR